MGDACGLPRNGGARPVLESRLRFLSGDAAGLESLGAWPVRLRAPQLLLISTGTPEQNRALGLTAPIVLDPGFAEGRAFGAGGTPSAVLVNSEGRITFQTIIAPALKRC